MSVTVTHQARVRGEHHFEPEAALDPLEQRKLRGHLEQIDYAAFAANRQIIAQAMGRVSQETFERLATAAARARVQWTMEAAAMAAPSGQINPEQAERLAALRNAYEELTEAYEALRRMVERGYVSYQSGPSPR